MSGGAMPKISYDTGTYVWVHDESLKVYVGSTSRAFGLRKQEHLKLLRNGEHHSPYFQHAWDKYGEEAFTFVVLEECEPERCIDREQYWLDFYESYNPTFGYNTCRIAGSTLGYQFTEEQRAKMREVNQRTKNDPVVRAKLSAATQRNWDDPEKRKLMTEANQRRVTDAFRAKRSKHMLELAADPAWREAMSKDAKVRCADPEWRRQRAEQQKRLWEDPIYRANQVAKRMGKGKKLSEEGLAARREKFRLRREAKFVRQAEQLAMAVRGYVGG